MPAGICPRQLEVGLERGGKVVGGSALDEKQFGRTRWETSRARQDRDDGLSWLQFATSPGRCRAYDIVLTSFTLVPLNRRFHSLPRATDLADVTAGERRIFEALTR